MTQSQFSSALIGVIGLYDGDLHASVSFFVGLFLGGLSSLVFWLTLR